MEPEDLAKHKIRQVRAYTTFWDLSGIQANALEERRFLAAEHHYDEKGNEVERREYDHEGNLEMKEVFVFDDESRLVERKELIDVGVMQRFTYAYDENGRRSEIRMHWEDGSADVTKHMYEGEHLVEQRTEDEDGEIEKQVLILRNEAGKIIEEKVIQYDEQESRTTREYDEEGRESCMIVFDADDEEIMREERTYDAEGRVIQSTVVDHSSERQSGESNYTYDEKGRMTEVSLKDEASQMARSQKTSYDDRDLPILTEVEVNFPGRPTQNLKREYEYLTEV